MKECLYLSLLVVNISKKAVQRRVVKFSELPDKNAIQSDLTLLPITDSYFTELQWSKATFSGRLLISKFTFNFFKIHIKFFIKIHIKLENLILKSFNFFKRCVNEDIYFLIRMPHFYSKKVPQYFPESFRPFITTVIPVI